MRRAIGALAVALAASACGSTARLPANQTATGATDEFGDVASATTTVGAETAAAESGPTAAGRTVTTKRSSSQAGSTAAAAAGKPATGPIEIGFVRTGVSNAAAFGASLGGTASEADIVAALVNAYNDKGGIAGRRIVPVYADSDTGSASWDADFAAACADFTQDHKVAAVVGYVFTHIDSFEACLAKKGVPHLSTTFNVPDAATLARYPTLVALSTPLIERRSVVKIDGALATGVITRASKIGIVLDSCPGTKAAWEKVTKPYMLSKGLNIASIYEIGCAGGAGDAGAEAGRVGGIVLQFRSANVDTISLMTTSEGPGIFVFSGVAEAQSYRPKYVVSSLANTAVLANQLPAPQAANVHGYGWLPVQDTTPQYWPSVTPAASRCLSMLKSKGITPTAPADYGFAFSACEGLFLYEIALKANQGRSDGLSIIASIEALGSTYNSVSNLDGRSTFGRTRHDAPAQARYFAWTPNCSCFTYRPSVMPIP
jgi:ABC-type branched-subunit amino acid transport system substrate-binding protein